LALFPLPLSYPRVKLAMSRRDVPDIPQYLHETLTAPESTARAIEAMQTFLIEGDQPTFEYAVALYVAAARQRNEPIERITGALCMLAENLQGPRRDAEFLLHPTRMHELVFNGILRAFYGDVAVDRAIGASEQRKADAKQHIKSGTWPKRPV